MSVQEEEFEGGGGGGGVGVGDFNATSGPQLTTDVQFNSFEFVSWGQMWQ